MKYILLIIIGLSFLCVGCYVNQAGDVEWGFEPPPPDKDPDLIVDASDSVLVKYEIARVNEKRNNYIEALKLYSELLNEPVKSSVYQSAFLGRTRVLISMNKLPNALASLEPLSQNPNTLFECRKLSMAARILDRQHRYTEAETILKVAIDKCPKRIDAEIFLAESLSALGYIEFKLQKHTDAIRFFRKASELFEKNDLGKRARSCTEIADYIENN